MSKYMSKDGKRMLANQLFWEMATDLDKKEQKPAFTLKNQDHVDVKGKVYPSMYRMFMESADEYEAAMTILGDFAHWEYLCTFDWFMDGTDHNGCQGLNKWREHMKLRDASIGKKALVTRAKEGDVQAAKVLHSGATPSKRGRKKAQTSDPMAAAKQKIVDLNSRRSG